MVESLLFWRRRAVGVILFGLMLVSLPLAAQVVDLKVLVIATGNVQEDAGLDLIDDMLDQLGVPYEVLDSSREELTPARLADGEHGFYSGIIVTESQLMVEGFTKQEWQILHDYERKFAIRESVISGFPARNSDLGLDYGMANIESGNRYTGIWQDPAGGSELFEYVNTANTIPVTDFAFAGEPICRVGSCNPTGSTPAVQPLLLDQATGKVLVSRLFYEDGREVLLSTISNAWFLIHSQILNYEFLNFATKGVFIGARKVYLAAHLDDLFIADDLWNPVTNQTDLPPYRNTSEDIDGAVLARQDFISRHSTIDSQFKLDFAFNGVGAGIPMETVRDRFAGVSFNNNDGDLKWKGPWQEKDPEGKGAAGGKIKVKKGKLIVKGAKNTGIQPAVERKVNLKGATKASLSLSLEIKKAKKDDAVYIEISNDGNHWDVLERFLGKLKKTNRSYDITGFAEEDTAVRIRVDHLQAAYSKDDDDGKSNKSSYKGEVRIDEIAISKEVDDPLTRSIMANKAYFRFINHTYSHPDMDASAGMSYTQLSDEILQNQYVWQVLGLPEYEENLATIVTGNHSGLEDKMGTEEDFTDDVSYPDGMNTTLMQVLEDLEFKYIASDTSRKNQDNEGYVPGFDLFLLPRYPANLFYNVNTPELWEDEYNYIFYERYIENNQDPCFIPGAICKTRTLEQILEAEAETAFRHMLGYLPRPHYFHISNLHQYSPGKFLIFDWLDSVLTYYEERMTLPVVNLPFYEIGKISEDKLHAQAAKVVGQWDLATDMVTLKASRQVDVDVTGLQGGKKYGGQLQRQVRVGPVPVKIPVNRQLN